MALLVAGGALLLAIGAGYYSGRSAPGSEAHTNSLLYLVGMIAGVVALITVVRHPGAGLLILIVLLYTNASEVAVRLLAVPSPLQWLAMALLGLIVVRWLLGGGERDKRLILSPVLMPLVLYAAIVFGSSLVATDVALTDERLVEHLKGILIFLVVTNLATTPAALKRVVWGLVASGAILGTISVYQVLTGSFGEEFGGFGRIKIAQIVGESREPRISGPLSDPNFYAQILVALVPLALYRLWDERSITGKVAAGYALAVITVASVFTYSRGGALALGLVLLAALVHRKVRLKYLVLGLAVLAPISLVLPEGFAGRLTTLQQVALGGGGQQDEDSSFRQRRLLMTAACDMFADRPILGVGAGNYTEHFSEYAGRIGSTQRSYDEFGDRHYPHSLYLELLAESGLLGFIAFLSILGAAFYSLLRGFRDFRRTGATEMADIAISVALALAAYLTTSVLLHGHFIQYLWLLVALAAAVRQVALRVREPEPLS